MDKTNIDHLPRALRVTNTVKIGIAGMTSEDCVRKVERALRGLAGIKKVHVDRTRALATVTYDDTQVDVPRMQDALLQSGYTPTPGPVP